LVGVLVMNLRSGAQMDAGKLRIEGSKVARGWTGGYQGSCFQRDPKDRIGK
jgi:hypothetical protein